jgi:hypothetical protein
MAEDKANQGGQRGLTGKDSGDKGERVTGVEKRSGDTWQKPAKPPRETAPPRGGPPPPPQQTQPAQNSGEKSE